MKLVNLEQQIFIPVVDETHGGVTVEMQMTVGAFFAKCCQGFEPEVVEAIPVEWLRGKMNIADDAGDLDSVDLFSWILQTWQKEQEAR